MGRAAAFNMACESGANRDIESLIIETFSSMGFSSLPPSMNVILPDGPNHRVAGHRLTRAN